VTNVMFCFLEKLGENKYEKNDRADSVNFI